jgi:hypothetical protein
VALKRISLDDLDEVQFLFFFSGSFYDAVSITDYMASSGSMIK